MQKTDHVYQAYCEVLRRELTAASGCTEPIALAYCAAKARQTLGRMPERVRVQVSGNIIKNVKSVTVPNTGGLRGIPAAVAAGIVAGDAERALEVIRDVSEEQQRAIRRMLDTCPIEVEFLPSDDLLDMIVMVQSGVEQKNIEKAREEILRQLQAVQEGDFSAEDLDAAKMSVANSFRTMSDYLGGLEAWYLSQAFEKTVLTPEQSAEAVGGVTKEQVVKAAQTVSLDTVYQLTGKEEA